MRAQKNPPYPYLTGGFGGIQCEAGGMLCRFAFSVIIPRLGPFSRLGLFPFALMVFPFGLAFPFSRLGSFLFGLGVGRLVGCGLRVGRLVGCGLWVGGLVG